MGVVCKGRLGLGHYSEKRWSRADARARRGLVVQRVRETEEEERQVKAIGLASPGPLDSMGSGTGAPAILEGPAADRPRKVELPSAP